jgi:hypothetical protein
MGTCPNCDEPFEAGARFCEGCGCDLAVVRLHLSACRPFYDWVVDEDDLPFPDDPPRGSFDLAGERITVGRLRAGKPTDREPRDVDIPLTDPGVSQCHCTFERNEILWSVRDADSTNGTWVDESDRFRRLAPDEHWPLSDGDRILVGGWTCLTVEILQS